MKKNYLYTLCSVSLLLALSACGGDDDSGSGSYWNRQAPYSSNEAFRVSSISPTSGSASGGSSVYIYGSGFQSGVAVKIGGVSCKNVDFRGSSYFSCRPGAGKIGSADVVVTNPDSQTATLTGGYRYSSITPYLSSASPLSAPTRGGTEIVLRGWDFMAEATVTIAGVPCAPVTLHDSEKLSCFTGASPAVQQGEVVVTNPENKTGILWDRFEYFAPVPPGGHPPQPAQQPQRFAGPFVDAGAQPEEDQGWLDRILDLLNDDQPLVFRPAPRVIHPVPVVHHQPQAPLEHHPLAAQDLQDFNLGELQHHDPEPNEIQIYDQMMVDLNLTKAKQDIKEDIAKEIRFFKVLFNNRAMFLEEARLAEALHDPGRLQLWNPPIGEPVFGLFHAEQSKEAGGQALPVRQRLNYIHGLWTKSYLKAKKDNQLPLFFFKAFRAELPCVDVRSEMLLDRFVNPYLLENYELSHGCRDKSDYYNRIFEVAQADATFKDGKGFNADYAKPYLQKKVGTQFLGHALGQDFVDEGIQYGENILAIF